MTHSSNIIILGSLFFTPLDKTRVGLDRTLEIIRTYNRKIRPDIRVYREHGYDIFQSQASQYRGASTLIHCLQATIFATTDNKILPGSILIFKKLRDFNIGDE